MCIGVIIFEVLEFSNGNVLRLQQDDELSGKKSPSLSGPTGYFWRKRFCIMHEAKIVCDQENLGE